MEVVACQPPRMAILVGDRELSIPVADNLCDYEYLVIYNWLQGSVRISHAWHIDQPHTVRANLRNYNLNRIPYYYCEPIAFVEVPRNTTAIIDKNITPIKTKYVWEER